MIHQPCRSLLCVSASLLLFPLIFASCSTSQIGADTPAALSRSSGAVSAENFVSDEKSGEEEGRMRIYQGSQTVEVTDPAASATKAEEFVRTGKGYVESSSASSNGESRVTLTLRVPAGDFREIMDEIAALGNETYRRTTAKDTTDAHVDLEARLKNKAALRDRLRSLLDSAKTVKETLEIEKELARVQSDLDAMQARLQLMKSQVSLAKIELTLKSKEIPGPIGAAGKGLWWSIRKLFVLK